MPKSPQPRVKRAYHKLSDEDWNSISAVYAAGGISIAELAERYPVSARTIQTHLAALAHASGKTAPTSRVPKVARAPVEVISAPTDQEGRITETRETAYLAAASVQTFLLAALKDCQDLPAAVRIRIADKASAVIDRLQKTRRLALGVTAAHDEAAVPLDELTIRELTDDEVREMRAAQVAEDTETDPMALSGDYDGDGIPEDMTIIEEGPPDEANCLASAGATEAGVLAGTTSRVPSPKAFTGWLG